MQWYAKTIILVAQSNKRCFYISDQRLCVIWQLKNIIRQLKNIIRPVINLYLFKTTPQKVSEHTGHFVQPHVAADCGGDIYSRRKPLFSSLGEHTAVCGSSVRQAVARPRHRQSVCIHNIHFAATCRPSVLGSATMRGHMWLNKVASVLGPLLWSCLDQIKIYYWPNDIFITSQSTLELESCSFLHYILQSLCYQLMV